MLDVGLPTAAVANYNDLTGVALQINSALPRGKRNPDEVMAEKFVSVVNRISDKIETQLFVRMELAKATGDLEKTNECILEVLGDIDVEEEGLSLVGHAAAGRGRRSQQGALPSALHVGEAPSRGGPIAAIRKNIRCTSKN